MHAYLARFCCFLLAWLILSSFRIGPHANNAQDMPLLYDVRGAFVSATPTIPAGIVKDVDKRLGIAIRATFRKTLLPRAILTVRLVEIRRDKVLIGATASARVAVEATAVGNGEKIAVGDFTVTAYSLQPQSAEALLAKRIADRVASEFRLDESTPSTLATALFP